MNWNDRRRSVECTVRHCPGSANARMIKQGLVVVLKRAMNLTRCLEIETTGWRRLFSVTKNLCYGALQGTDYTQQKRGSIDVHHSSDIIAQKDSEQSIPPRHRQMSFRMTFPLSGVVNTRFEPDSHVTLPRNLRMYLYWISVSPGRVTLTVNSHQVNKGAYKHVDGEAYRSKSDSSQGTGSARCPATNL
jgi:hypothetical protein